MDYKMLEEVNKQVKLTDVGRGKEYAEVPQRVLAFRKLFPEGTIETDMISNENGVCIFKAVARIGEKVLGTGHAYEKEGNGFINKTSYIENCETSAVGRALGFLGIGIDSGIASYEEVANAKKQQQQMEERREEESQEVVDTKEMEQKIKKLVAKANMTIEDFCRIAKVNDISNMHPEQMKNAIPWLEGVIKEQSK